MPNYRLAREVRKAFGLALKELRNKKHLSQFNLAISADLDPSYVSLLETGKRQPTIAVMYILADALEVNAKELLSLTDEYLPKQKP